MWMTLRSLINSSRVSREATTIVRTARRSVRVERMAIARTVMARRDITLNNSSSTTSTMMIETMVHPARARTATVTGMVCGEERAKVQRRWESEVHRDGSLRVHRTFVWRTGVMRGTAESSNLAGTASEGYLNCNGGWTDRCIANLSLRVDYFLLVRAGKRKKAEKRRGEKWK